MSAEQSAKVEKKPSTSIDQAEISHFTKDSSHWWDINGPFKPLHRVNPTRLKFIKSQICTHFNLNDKDIKSLKNINILDIGCGGGLVCEPLARMGASVTGVDADYNAIDVAKNHALQSNLDINYSNEDLENLNKSFDVVLALEVIEHVKDVEIFIKTAKTKLKPGGIIIFSTLNRTAKSLALGIIALEYVLQWVPKGTHSWEKFVKPSELVNYASKNNLKPLKLRGITFNPLTNTFKLSKTDFDINYIISFMDN